MSTGKVLLGVVAGAATGALLGILFAPHKGSKTRDKIAQKGNDYLEGFEEKFNEYFSIEKMESSVFFRIMADFAENIEDKRDNQFFVRVLNDHKPMANFNHHIHQSNYREAWFANKKQAYIDYAQKEICWFD